MSVQDATAPPVIFVVGTAGAGKSSLVTAFQRWARFLEVDALTINLDPGAERVHYDPEFDVRDLIRAKWSSNSCSRFSSGSG